jgi:hypothetical protein
VTGLWRWLWRASLLRTRIGRDGATANNDKGQQQSETLY